MSLLPKEGKILALDIGTRRTGVALSDAKQRVAFLKPEIEHKSEEELFKSIEKWCTEEKVVGLIAGVPLKLDGTESEQTRQALNMIEKLKALKLPIQEMDERLSSEFAQQKTGKKAGPRNKEVVDSISAQILLENHLNTL